VLLGGKPGIATRLGVGVTQRGLGARIVSAGRIHVEPKKDTISRIKRSPDDADASLLAFYDNAPADLVALQGLAF
jgi:hypothetical protein